MEKVVPETLQSMVIIFTCSNRDFGEVEKLSVGVLSVDFLDLSAGTLSLNIDIMEVHEQAKAMRRLKTVR